MRMQAYNIENYPELERLFEGCARVAVFAPSGSMFRAVRRMMVAARGRVREPFHLLRLRDEAVFGVRTPQRIPAGVLLMVGVRRIAVQLDEDDDAD
jgi:hypothetical protein